MTSKSNNYSKFVAAAATATMVASAIVVPASAASFSDVSSTYKKAVDYLIVNDIAKGTSDTTFGTTASITRGDAAVMIANALKLDTAKAPSAGFTDVNSRVAGAVNALVQEKIVSGKTATTFEPGANITRQEMAKIVANAYDLKAGTTKNEFTDVNSNWDGFVDALVANEITFGKTATTFASTASITRGEFALFVYRAENLAPATTVAEVVSVNAINAKTIEVIFSSPVNADTLQNAAKEDVIKVNAGKDATATDVTQTLSENGKTLTLTAANFFKGDYTIAVPFEIVKATTGEFVKPVNKTVNVNDLTAPVVTSATSTVKDTKENVKLVTVEFNEEIKALDFIKISGQNHTPVSIEGNVATFEVNLDATKNYDITVVNATDAAGNVKALQTTGLTIIVDNQAPSITNVVATGEQTLTVTVDEALKNKLALTGKIGTFNANVISSVKVNPKNNKEYFVTLNDAYQYKNGNSDSVTLTAEIGSLSDSMGNTNADVISKTVVVSKDITAPTVENVEVKEKDGIVTGFTVSYSEEVTGLDITKASLVNGKEEILSFANIATAKVSKNEVVVTLKSNVKPETYTFNFAEGIVTDKSLAKNKANSKTVVINVKAAEEPVETVFTISGATATKNVITVNFGEKVKASALNASAYKLNGVTLPADTKIAFVKNESGVVDQTQVEITLPAGLIATSDLQAIFQVEGVQTLDNKVNKAFTTSVAVTDNKAPEAKSFVTTDLDEITVTYTEAVQLAADAVVTDEIKLFDDKGAAVAITASTIVDDKLVLTVADASKVTKLTTVASETVDVKDAAGVSQKTGLTVNK